MAARSEYASPQRIFARPAPGALWRGPQQTLALAHLVGERSLKILLGPPSSGKSTILAHLPYVMDEAVVLGLAGAQSRANGVLGALLSAARLGPFSADEVERRNLLVTFMRRQSLEGQRIVICIDGASGFSPDAWLEIERLRLVPLANRASIELAVVGTDPDTARPPLREWLHDGATSAIEAVHFLSAPSDDEVAAYVEWWLGQFRVTTRFSAQACQLINRLASGRYGLINLLCQLALREHSPRNARSIETDAVKKAAISLAALKNKAVAAGAVPARPVVEPVPAEPGCVEPVRAEPVRAGEPRLVVSYNGTVIREVQVRRRLMIGSAEDSDLHLPNPSLSRHHALITLTPDGTYHIADLHSAQGMRVNDQPVHSRALHDRDVISLGPFRLSVELTDGP